MMSLYLTKQTLRNREWMYRHTFLDLDTSCQMHSPGDIPPSSHLIGSWVGPTAGLDDMTLTALELMCSASQDNIVDGAWRS
jgi:hypothetical protein